jgi:hypothetical protein
MVILVKHNQVSFESFVTGYNFFVAFDNIFCRASFDILDVRLVWVTLMPYEILRILLSEMLPLECTSFLQDDPPALSERRNTLSSESFRIVTSS